MAFEVPPPLQLQQYVAAPDPTQPPRFLGKGQYCVYLYRDTANDRLVAVKRINLQDPQRARSLQRDLPRELRIHHGLNHPLIVKMFDAIVTPHDGYINIVMEYVEGGMLLDQFNAEFRQTGTINEETARWFFQQLIVTLDYLHAKGVVHRDIKLDNVLCQPTPGQVLPQLKVADFGLSRTGEVAGTDVGTKEYKAPEVFRDEQEAQQNPAAQQNPGEARYAAAPVDVWSAGVLLCAALNMNYPFEPQQYWPLQQILEHLTGTRPMVHRFPRSPECVDLIEQMLRPEPAARITLPGILRHPWFLQGLDQQDPGLLQLRQQCLGLPSPCALSTAQLDSLIVSVDQILGAITGVHAVNNVAA